MKWYLSLQKEDVYFSPFEAKCHEFGVAVFCLNSVFLPKSMITSEPLEPHLKLYPGTRLNLHAFQVSHLIQSWHEAENFLSRSVAFSCIRSSHAASDRKEYCMKCTEEYVDTTTLIFFGKWPEERFNSCAKSYSTRNGSGNDRANLIFFQEKVSRS